MKKNKWAENVQFREKGNTREVNVTAKECARREDIIIKEFFTIKRGLIYTVEKKGVPLGQDLYPAKLLVCKNKRPMEFLFL